jgi:hypothetical protein
VHTSPSFTSLLCNKPLHPAAVVIRCCLLLHLFVCTACNHMAVQNQDILVILLAHPLCTSPVAMHCCPAGSSTTTTAYSTMCSATSLRRRATPQALARGESQSTGEQLQQQTAALQAAAYCRLQCVIGSSRNSRCNGSTRSIPGVLAAKQALCVSSCCL